MIENNELEEYIKKYKKVIASKRKEIITSLTVLSLLLTGASYVIHNDRRDSKERLYRTREYTYNEYYNKDSVRSDYKEESDESHTVLIRKVSPWIIDGIEARREIHVYRINDMTFDELKYKGNYKKVIKNMSYEIQREYKYKNELRINDRYEEAYFEVVDITQNKEDYIENTRPVSMGSIVLLLSEIVIYGLAVELNGGPFYETIINDIKDINICKDNIKILKK